MLKEVVDNKISDILIDIESHKKENIDEELLSKLENISNGVHKDIDYLKKVSESDLDVCVNTVFENNNILERLKNYKKIIEARSIATNDLIKDIFSISDEQKKDITGIFDVINSYIEKEKAKRSKIDIYEEELEKYKLISDKIKKENPLTKYDYVLIHDLLNDIKPEDKYKILKEYLMYIDKNNDKQETEELSEEKIESNYQKYLEIVLWNLPIEKIGQFQNIALDYKKEIADNFDEEKVKGIIDVLKQRNIFSKFEQEVLMAITLYSDPKTIEESIMFLKKEKLYDYDIPYTYSGLWIDYDKYFNDEKENKKELRKGKKSLLESAKSMSKQLIKDKIETLESLGFSKDDIIAKSNSYFSNSADSVLNMLEVCEKYHLNVLKEDENGKMKGKPSVFKTGNKIAEKCDICVECNILEPTYLSNEKSKETYVNNFPTYLSSASRMNTASTLILQTLLEENIYLPNDRFITYDSCFGRPGRDGHKVDENRLNEDFRNHFGLNLNNSVKIKEFMHEHDMVLIDDEVPRYNEMKDSIIDNLVEYNDDTINSDFIKELDDKYKENNYSYNYNGKKISRYKVLRLYESLKKYNLSNPSKEFNEEDIRLFSIGYNTFMKHDTLIKLKEEIYKNERKR